LTPSSQIWIDQSNLGAEYLKQLIAPYVDLGAFTPGYEEIEIRCVPLRWS
jgi:hypothetical protein